MTFAQLLASVKHFDRFTMFVYSSLGGAAIDAASKPTGDSMKEVAISTTTFTPFRIMTTAPKSWLQVDKTYGSGYKLSIGPSWLKYLPPPIPSAFGNGLRIYDATLDTRRPNGCTLKIGTAAKLDFWNLDPRLSIDFYVGGSRTARVDFVVDK